MTCYALLLLMHGAAAAATSFVWQSGCQTCIPKEEYLNMLEMSACLANTLDTCAVMVSAVTELSPEEVKDIEISDSSHATIFYDAAPVGYELREVKLEYAAWPAACQMTVSALDLLSGDSLDDAEKVEGESKGVAQITEHTVDITSITQPKRETGVSYVQKVLYDLSGCTADQGAGLKTLKVKLFSELSTVGERESSGTGANIVTASGVRVLLASMLVLFFAL